MVFLICFRDLGIRIHDYPAVKSRPRLAGNYSLEKLMGRAVMNPVKQLDIDGDILCIRAEIESEKPAGGAGTCEFDTEIHSGIGTGHDQDRNVCRSVFLQNHMSAEFPA